MTSHFWRMAVFTLISSTSVLVWILIVRRTWAESGKQKWIPLIFLLLVSYGGVGFLLPFAAASGALWFVPKTIEWPVLAPEDVVEDSTGRRVVALVAIGRIQVYAKDGTFLAGWFVDAGGGSFITTVTRVDQIEVHAARMRRRFLFSQEGDLLESRIYGEDYASIARGRQVAVAFNTPLVLWPLASPYAAWALIAIGIIGSNPGRWARPKTGEKVRP